MSCCEARDPVAARVGPSDPPWGSCCPTPSARRSPFGFLIALLFLVAGLLTPGSHDRKGGRRFVEDRLLRLGVPFVVYVFLVQPTLVYVVVHPLGDASGSSWQEYLGAERQIDTGPLWFVGVLLVFSLAYAAWRRLAARAGSPTSTSGNGRPASLSSSSASGPPGTAGCTPCPRAWCAAAFAGIEALLVVLGPVWLLDLARRRLEHRLPWGEQAGRSAYGAFMLQTVFLLALAVALRPVPFAAEVKAVLVAAGAVAASFGAAWVLIQRVPGMARVI